MLASKQESQKKQKRDRKIGGRHTLISWHHYNAHEEI